MLGRQEKKIVNFVNDELMKFFELSFKEASLQYEPVTRIWLISFLFFFQMKLSSIISAVMLLGLISLSSANRIPHQHETCEAACQNFANNCDIMDECPTSCDVNDEICIITECRASWGCNSRKYVQKREKREKNFKIMWLMNRAV